MKFSVLAVGFLATLPQWVACAQLPQRQVLEVFYNTTGGATSWSPALTTGWLDPAVNECDWNGVTCGPDNLIVGLNRFFVGLNGDIPTELGDLTMLTSLSFTSNPNLRGTIPTELVGATGLSSLSLGFTAVSGEIPTELFQLTELTSLILGSTSLNGAIPTEIGLLTNLRSVGLDSMSGITGTLPSEVGLLANVFEFIVQDTCLTGTLPTEIGNMASLFRAFFARGCYTGTVPAQVGNWVPTLEGAAGLPFVYFQGAELEGTIPDALCQVARLNDFNVDTYGCDAIACSLGTSQSAGISDPSGDQRGVAFGDNACLACPFNETTPFIGSLSSSACAEIPPTPVPTMAPTETSGASTQGGNVLSSAVLVTMAMFASTLL